MTEARKAFVILFSPGLSPRHRLMLGRLKDQGWEVTAAAWDRSGGSTVPEEAARVCDEWQWVKLPAPTWSLKLVLSLPALYRKLWRIMPGRGQADLIMFTHLALLPLVLTAKNPAVYDAPEMYRVDFSHYFKRLRGTARLVVSWIENRLVSRVRGVSTVDSRSGWLAAEYRKHCGRVQVIWNAPALADDPDQDRARALEPEYAGRRVLAFVGGLMREKGLRVALGVTARLKESWPDLLSVFIGPLKDRPDEVERLIRDLGIEDRVKFLPTMGYREMMAHLSWAEVGLALYQNEYHYHLVSAGNGRKFLTYMQAGLPVVGPDFGEVGRLVKMTGVGLLVDTGDVQAVTWAVDWLLGHPDEAVLMGRRGRRAFETEYNWEKEAEKYDRFVRDCLSGP